MKKIRSSKKGFTLAELLIVVAIIGVLVGISIPIFSAQLEKSREATDVANLRAAKAAAVAQALTGTDLDGKAITGETTVTCYYDAESGKLVKDKPATGYGKGTINKGGCADFKLSTVATDTTKYTQDSAVAGDSIQIEYDVNGNVTMSWA